MMACDCSAVTNLLISQSHYANPSRYVRVLQAKVINGYCSKKRNDNDEFRSDSDNKVPKPKVSSNLPSEIYKEYVAKFQIKYESVEPDSNGIKLMINKLAVREADKEYFKRRSDLLQYELDNTKKLLQKVGVFSYMRSKFEIYEWILNVPPIKGKPELETLSEQELEEFARAELLNTGDQMFKKSLIVHFDRWLNILTYSTDTKIVDFKIHVMKKLKFDNVRSLAKYIAVSYCILSNIGHNFPDDAVDYGCEDEVIDAIKKWNIKDEYILNAIRAVYRLSHSFNLSQAPEVIKKT